MKTLTLEQVELLKEPAVYFKRFDTRQMGFDGKRFSSLMYHRVDAPEKGVFTEELELSSVEWPYKDLPTEGWRHLFGCGCDYCKGKY